MIPDLPGERFPRTIQPPEPAMARIRHALISTPAVLEPDLAADERIGAEAVLGEQLAV